MDYTDVILEHRNHVAYITINRPEVMNAFRGRTCEELIHAFQQAGYDRDIGAIVFAGAGDRARIDQRRAGVVEPLSACLRWAESHA